MDRQTPPVSISLSMYRHVISEAPIVTAVAAGKKHQFSKKIQSTITLLAGFGVESDVHCGAYVQHLYDKAKNPTRPNLRQVHLVQQELLEQLRTLGFALTPGQLGENITTLHINLPRLAEGTPRPWQRFPESGSEAGQRSNDPPGGRTELQIAFWTRYSGGGPSLIQIADREAPPACLGCGRKMRYYADFEIYECRECRLFLNEIIRSDVNKVTRVERGTFMMR